jgi:hypothetical protein
MVFFFLIATQSRGPVLGGDSAYIRKPALAKLLFKTHDGRLAYTHCVGDLVRSGYDQFATVAEQLFRG